MYLVAAIGDFCIKFIIHAIYCNYCNFLDANYY